MTRLPKFIELTEVGPRDGLQSQAHPLSTEQKIQWIHSLMDAGLKRIEVGSFVSPKAVPAMADTADVIAGLTRKDDVKLMVLVPNARGMEGAVTAGADEIAVFTAASETFCEKNINTSIAGSFERFTPVIAEAKSHKMAVRGYVSCMVSCPYEGAITPSKLWEVCDKLFEAGCDEVDLGDTLGVANPLQCRRLFTEVARRYDKDKIVAHFHDTYGRALANIWECLQLGFTKYDASAGGLGGCPYAPGASGNVATDDLNDFLLQLDLVTWVEPRDLQHSSKLLQSFIASPLPSRFFQAKNH